MAIWAVHRERVLTRFNIEADDLLDAINQARQCMIEEARTVELHCTKMSRPAPYDWARDERSEQHYEFTEDDAATEAARDRRFAGRIPEGGADPYGRGI